MNQSQYKQIVWDYNLKLKDFQQILAGKKKMGWLNQEWAIGRVLENLNYYEARKLISLKQLAQYWPKVKKRIYNKTIKKGYDFVLHQYTLSTAR
ncbi:hypothetical protein KJ678_04320 [Patescibacteria group bacterium]|nr:hypothetical protein [Patescibacteria group bacterium]